MNNRIQPGETFLKKQKLVIHRDSAAYAVPNEELLALSKLKPNRRVLLARFNLGIYTLVPDKALERSIPRLEAKCRRKNEKRKAKGKLEEPCTNLWTWMAYTVGEPPALLDSAKLERSADQMRIYLNKQGYFNARIEPEVIYRKKGIVWWRKGNKAKVRFHVYPGQPYRLRSINYRFEDTGIAGREANIRESSTLRIGDIFNVGKLDKEREELSAYLNDRGYYAFTKDYITYDADSTLGHHTVDLTLKLNGIHRATSVSDSIAIENHKRYFIGEVYIHTVYDPRNPDAVPLDTLLYDNYLILYNKELQVRPSLLSYTSLLNPAEGYQRSKVDLTYKRFVQLGVYKSVTIQLIPRSDVDSMGINFIDVKILLHPNELQSIIVDPRVTNRAGNMGIYGNFAYRHINLNKGAQRLEGRLIGGFEAAQTVGQTSANNQGIEQLERNLRLNTFEIGPEFSLRIPLVKPLPILRFQRSSEPSAIFTALLNYQIRPDYERTLGQLNAGVSWIENPSKVRRMYVDIAEFSVIRINRSPEFDRFIAQLNDRFLANSYQDHLILATRLSMITNTQRPRSQRRYYFWRLSLEGAGNALRGIYATTNARRDAADAYEIAGIPFAQYVRVESDYRRYFNVNERNQFVWRNFIGVGAPLDNLPVLPFEKSFFSGGANGLRAWQARTLGPGASRDSSKTFNNIGDIKLEFNFEYRFKLTKMFQSALFIDAGNIWQMRPDPLRPNGSFSFDRFLTEFAIGTGIGLRLDFEYFLVRLDVGLQMHDPSKINGERWFWQPKDEYNEFLEGAQFDLKHYNFWRTRVFNLGIGFPF